MLAPTLVSGKAGAGHGKIERFNRKLAARFVFNRHCNSELAGRAALPAWIRRYDGRRVHTAIAADISRSTSLRLQYT